MTSVMMRRVKVQDDRAKIKPGHGDERRYGRHPEAVVLTAARGYGIDKPPGKNRAEGFGKRCPQHQQPDEGRAQGLLLPVAEGKAEHVAKGVGAEVELDCTHDDSPVPLSGNWPLQKEKERHSRIRGRMIGWIKQAVMEIPLAAPENGGPRLALT
jgi:hypothetical protein